MKRKLILICVAFTMFASLDFKAATIYATNGSEVTDYGNLCANDSYFYKTENNGMYQAEIINSKNHVLQATSNSNNGEIELVFPANAGELAIKVYEYVNKERTFVETVKVGVSDCGYDSVVDDYNATAPLTTITKTDLGYQFTEPDMENYTLYVNQLETKDDTGTSQSVKFADGVATEEVTADVLQITETYPNKEGKEVNVYYEVDFSNDELEIRKLSSVDLKVIEPMEYIDKKILIRTFIGLIILVILYLLNISFSKRYRARKAYLKKYKLYQEKQKEAQRAQKLRNQELKKKKELAIQQQKLESERRANLGIRK